MKLPTEIRRRYLHRRLEDMKLLKNSVFQGDFSEAIRIGHQVKGNALTFEVPQIAHLGIEMEKAAKVQDKDKIFFIIQKMETELQGVFNESRI